MSRLSRNDEPNPDDRSRNARRPGWAPWAIGVLVLNLAVAALTLTGADGGVVSGLTDGLKSRLSRTRTSVRNSGLAKQIETRIRQEKTVDAGQIEIEVVDESTVVLKGLVADSDDKDKAVALARDTRGVLRVVDNLAVIPGSRVIDAPAAVEVPPSSRFAELPRMSR